MPANQLQNPTPRLSRRALLKRMAWGSAGLAVGGLAYTMFEAGWVTVRRETIAVPRLPQPFVGTSVAFLADVHHGPFTGLDYVQQAVQRVNALQPDLILLGGDYVHRDRRYIAASLQAHARLTAPMGVFGVLGNHDHWEGAAETRAAMKAASIVELTNTGVWLEEDGARLRVGGVGDLWEDTQDLDAALADARESDTSLVLSHNPDFAESVTDPRVGLVLSGHTHGGQVVFPGMGAPLVPSRFGQKYLRGLVSAPHTQVYVTSGLGTITPPVRFCCRPEIVLITIT